MPDAADIDTLNDALLASAQKPKSATIDGNNVNQFSVQEQIAASHHIAGQVASSKGHFGLRFTKLIPPEGG